MTVCPIQRVLLVSYSVVPSPTRQGVCLESLIKALGPRFEVDVLTVRSAEMGYVERYGKCRMLRVPIGGGTHAEQVETFRRAVRRQLEGAEYDLIHFRSAYGGVPICALREYLDSRLVFELGLTSSHEVGRLDPAALRTLITEERYCLQHCDLVIAESETAAESVRRTGVTAPVVAVTPGVDVDTFDWEPSLPQSVRRVLFVGRIQPGRGLRTLLEAFALVLQDMEAHLLLVGPVDPTMHAYLQDAVARLCLQSHLHLLGELDHDEIPRVLSMADVCVAPWTPGATTPLAGLPLKVLEYLACRRPTIAADGPTLRSVLGDPLPLIPVPPEDSETLALELRRLLSEPHRGERLAEAGYRLVRDRRSAAAARRDLLSAYSRLVPAGANLWGHAKVSQSRAGTTSGALSGPAFRDTVHDAGLGSGTLRTVSTQRPSEPWVELTADSRAGLLRGSEAEDASTDPEFEAAGALLTSTQSRTPANRVPRRDRAPGRGPLGAREDTAS